MVIVGISCSHDASACVLIDGRLAFAIQLERLTGIKHDGRPFLNSRVAVDYCLEAASLTAGDVDLFCFNSQNLLPGQVGLGFPLCDREFDLFDPIGDRSIFVSHHLCHAFSAFFCSPFQTSAVLVIDGSGGSVIGSGDLLITGEQLRHYIRRDVPVPRPGYHAESLYTFDQGGYALIDRHTARSFHPMCGSSSLGETYAAVSQYVFGDWQDGGKLMGLAPFGNAAAFGSTLLVRDPSGRLQFGGDWKTTLNHANARDEPMAYADLAARIQLDLEDAVLDRAGRAAALTGLQDLAYAGGVALNSAANQRIIEGGAVRSLFVLPASHDAGISIGAAAAGWFHSTGKTRGEPVTSDYLGKVYAPAVISRAHEDWAEWLEEEVATDDAIAAALADGEICGRFSGGAEFGPRALGHRSILAAAFDRSMWDRLNAEVKFREEFRPFAPIVAAEKAETYFDMGGVADSPYMLRIVSVRPEWRATFAAITHVNGTARVQTVDRQTSPGLHRILMRFADRSGHPLLINTSLNVRGRPIVETPRQAVEMLLDTGLDALALHDTLLRPARVKRSSLPGARVRLAPSAHLHADSTGDGIRHAIRSEAQTGEARSLSAPLFDLLARSDPAPISRRLSAHAASAREALLDELDQLVARHLVLACQT